MWAFQHSHLLEKLSRRKFIDQKEDHYKWLNSKSPKKGKQLKIFYRELTNLTLVDLPQSKFREVVFDSCTFKDSFIESSFDQCVFYKCKFIETDLSTSSISQCEFIESNLYDVNLTRTNLNNSSFDAETDYSNVDFSVAKYIINTSFPLGNLSNLSAKINRKTAILLAYTFCSIKCDDPEVKVAQNKLMNFANNIALEQQKVFEGIGGVFPNDTFQPLSKYDVDNEEEVYSTSYKNHLNKLKHKITNDFYNNTIRELNQTVGFLQKYIDDITDSL